ncbi:NrsF family protein [Magnetospirillum sulfuroxidans]|uniref:DUF1109 family protein n=1 Tax=Magnetospirillum sulfuroxidans TaxID=611300 RepID=A0ABS5IFJ0_9PROT|nr:NrsF family protein [Magnetospirillum sulfuroxidans]MBR9972498.1 DUF1109 family protein [Magnetospirillum sulfuroxidans]
MNTEDLIAQLGRQVVPVKRLAPPLHRLMRGLAVMVPLLALIVVVMGPRADLAERLTDPGFAIAHVAAIATGLCAAWAALASTVPGISAWRLALPVLPALVWLGSVGMGCLRDWVVRGTDSLVPAIHPQCLPEIAIISIVPISVLMVLLRRGAALNPGRTAVLAALAASALASATLDLFHHAEAAIIVLVWHFGGVVMLSAVFGLMGQRLFPPPLPR